MKRLPVTLALFMVVAVMTWVATAQAAAIHGRGLRVSVPAASHGGTSVGLVFAVVVVLAVVIGAAVYVINAHRRQPTPAVSDGERSLGPGDKAASDQERKAA